MAYKKYITRNGKIYGPYVYHSKRIDGKVVSEYHGLKKDKKSRKFILILIGSFILLLLIFWILFFSLQFSGRVVLDISENYLEGEPIKGSINLNLEKGELIPASSKIIIENNGIIQEYELKNLIEKTPQTGMFYLEELNISSTGEGFGIPGEKEIIPEIDFEYKIISKSSNPQEEKNKSKEIKNKTVSEEEPVIKEENLTEETPNETVPEEEPVIEEENSTEETPVEENNTGATITGNAVSEAGIFKRLFASITGQSTKETTKQGKVSKDDPYFYNLEKGDTIEMIEVSVNGEELQLNTLNYEIEENKLTVSTDYSIIEEGFGEEYLTKEETTYKIDFDKLETKLEEGPISIKVNYEENQIVDFNEVITPKEKDTELNITKISVDSLNLNLSEEEKQILKNNFGLMVVQTTSYKHKRKVIVDFEIGSNSMEHSYDSRLNEEQINSLIVRDKDLWLKDLARESKNSEAIQVRDSTYDNEFSL